MRPIDVVLILVGLIFILLTVLNGASAAHPSLPTTPTVYQRDLYASTWNRPKLRIKAIVTAYSSTPEETDSSPFITANGTRVHRGVIANNCLSFGTEVQLESPGASHADASRTTYVVLDRMSRRYDCTHFDVWFPTRGEAIRWGKRTVTVEEL